MANQQSTDALRTKLGLGGAQAHRTLADRAFATIHDGILSGALPAGERLPIEDVAATLDMSPMPVREALRRLDAAGLVEHIPHRGARVTDLSIEDLVDVYQARLAVEPLAVRRATEELTDEVAEAASDALDALERESRRTHGLWPAHSAFHFALYEGSHSRWLVRLIRPLWESSERYRIAFGTRTRIAVRQEEHQEILDAVLARDSDRAAALMQNHLRITANILAHEMGAQDVFPLIKVPKAKPKPKPKSKRGG
jgi:DNA-binding GntR family transcriptional regulator